MVVRRLFGALSLVAMLIALPVFAAAQNGSLAERLDLAAMALDSADVPQEYRLFSEQYVRVDVFAEQYTGGVITVEELEATGLSWFYESRYATVDDESQIRSYVSQFETEEGAADGFALLEDEDRLVPDGGEFENLPGPEAGEEPKEITVGAFDPDPEGDDPALQTVDATFRVGTLIAGVALETIGETPPDQQLVEDLALRLEERITQVLNGDMPDGIEPALRDALLPLDQEALSVQEGYLNAEEALGTIDALTAFAVADSPLANYESGYVQTVGFGQEAPPNIPLPLVTVAVSSFAAPEDALALIEVADDLQPPFRALERIEGVTVEGADAVAAYHFATPFGEAEDANSFRVMLVVGGLLATVDVQGLAQVEVSEQVALDLAAQQASCLGADEPCEAVALPEGLVIGTET